MFNTRSQITIQIYKTITNDLVTQYSHLEKTRRPVPQAILNTMFRPLKFLSLQARKPTGLFGQYVMTSIFNSVNADLNSLVKEILNPEINDRILEIGFGSGKLIHEMAEIITEGIIEGVDFSDAMLNQASKVNRQYISSGAVKLQKGECSNLPYDNESFHKLCSVNTLYFLSEPDKCFLETFRVLKQGGEIVIGFRDDKQMNHLNLNRDIFNTYSLDEVVELLTNSGFSNAQIVKKDGKWLMSYCAVATKPTAQY
jgi:SAM-dependent methyltransferase